MTTRELTTPYSQRCIEPTCRESYGINERLYVCKRCGGLLDIEITSEVEAQSLKKEWRGRRASFAPADQSGVWRFRELLPFSPDTPIVSLREGNTPLYDAPRSAAYCYLDSLKLKHQGLNPTGSFKDTGMTTAVTQARLLGARWVACASTGNTAASLAAYAAQANLLCAIVVPAGQISHAKLAQALDYGARVLQIEGNFDDAMNVIRQLSQDNWIYLVNSINPFRIEGQKTVAAELLEQLDWQVPDHLVVPGGNLGNSSAFGKGFRELLRAGLIDRAPQISVVQAAGAAPFARLYTEQVSDSSESRLELVNEEQPHTLASAIKIGAPVSWKKAWRAVTETGGSILTVSEQEIADAKAIIGRDGIGCEPASATTVAGIRKLVAGGLISKNDSVVAVLTGHVLKDTDYVINYHQQTLQTSWGAEGDRSIAGNFSNKPVQVEAGLSALKRVLNEMREQEPASPAANE
jgi:threonine synthase